LIAGLAATEHRGIGVGQADISSRRDLVNQALLVVLGAGSSSPPSLLIDQVISVSRRATRALFGLSISWSPTPAARRCRTWPRVQGPRPRRPQGRSTSSLSRGGISRGSDHLVSPCGARGFPRHSHPAGHDLRDDPVLASCPRCHSLGSRTVLRLLRRRAGGPRSDHRHERRVDRGSRACRGRWRRNRQLPTGSARLSRRSHAVLPIILFSSSRRCAHGRARTTSSATLLGRRDVSFTTAHVAGVALARAKTDQRTAVPDAVERTHPGKDIPLSAVLGRDRDLRGLGVRRGPPNEDSPSWYHGWSRPEGYVLIAVTSHSFGRPKIAHERRPVDVKEAGIPAALVPVFGTDVRARAIRRPAKLVGEDAEGTKICAQVPAPRRLCRHARREELGRDVLESGEAFRGAAKPVEGAHRVD